MADPVVDPNTDFVYIRLGGDSSAEPARVTRTAYENVHKAKGFVIVDDEEAALALTPEAQLEAEPTTTKRK